MGDFLSRIEASIATARASEENGADYTYSLADIVLHILELCEKDGKNLSDAVLDRLGQAKETA